MSEEKQGTKMLPLAVLVGAFAILITVGIVVS